MSGATCPAQASGWVSMTRKRSPSGAPASASMRASWPPPSIPTVVTSAPDRDARVVVAGDLVALALAERGQRFGDIRVVDGQQRRGEQRRIRRTRRSEEHTSELQSLMRISY